ncbi:MAG: DnaD domain protein [Dehalococcoidales bacterium]
MTRELPGLPARMDYCAVPSYYLNVVMPWVDSLEELKLSLQIFRLISRKKGSVQYISRGELIADPAIIECLKTNNHPLEEVLDATISKVLARGIVLTVEVGDNNSRQSVYFLNTPANREAADSGKITTGNATIPRNPATPIEQMPNIFTCYEENIGMLTPLISDELRLAEQNYPVDWIIEAIGEAAMNNKRNWRYISRILERWLTEGKVNGAHRQNNPADDPSKYTTGKYQRFVQR